MLTHSEENYLKAIYALSTNNDEGVTTSELSARLQTKASSATDMVQKLAEKGLLRYKKYQGTTLTDTGRAHAVQVVRKHRLWEVFLSDKLGFGWDEVHDIAEQLEHIRSDSLADKLDHFLGYPKYDPHGDPIPDPSGKIHRRKSSSIHELSVGETGAIIGVEDSSVEFLQYLDRQKLVLGTAIEVLEVFDYDHSVKLLADQREITISHAVSKNIRVQTA